MIVSEESDSYVTPRMAGRVRYDGVLQQIHQLNTAGVPYRLYLQSDLPTGMIPDHRTYLFLNPYYVTAAERQAIEALKRDQKTLVFVHAPGAAGSDDPKAAVSAITGIAVERAQGLERAVLKAREIDHPLLQGTDGYLGTTAWPADTPVFAVTDGAATVLADYAGTDQGGLGVRDFGAWRSVFVGCPGLTDVFLNRLAAWSGCWTVADPGDAVYASESFLTVHGIFPGSKRLVLRKPSRVTDLADGRVLAESASRIEIPVARGETRWFHLEPR